MDAMKINSEIKTSKLKKGSVAIFSTIQCSINYFAISKIGHHKPFQ